MDKKTLNTLASAIDALDNAYDDADHALAFAADDDKLDKKLIRKAFKAAVKAAEKLESVL